MSDKYIYIKSYGCQMNVYDSNRIKDLFSNKGYKITKDISKADLTVLNTCHIREKAVEKVYCIYIIFCNFNENLRKINIICFNII